jgi:hypothetical protein
VFLPNKNRANLQNCRSDVFAEQIVVLPSSLSAQVGGKFPAVDLVQASIALWQYRITSKAGFPFPAGYRSSISETAAATVRTLREISSRAAQATRSHEYRQLDHTRTRVTLSNKCPPNTVKAELPSTSQLSRPHQIHITNPIHEQQANHRAVTRSG